MCYLLGTIWFRKYLMDRKKFQQLVQQRAHCIWTKEANTRGRHDLYLQPRDPGDACVVTELKPSADPCGTCRRIRPDHVRFDIIWSRTLQMWIWKCQSCSRRTNPESGLIEARSKQQQHPNWRPRDPVTGRLLSLK